MARPKMKRSKAQQADLHVVSNMAVPHQAQPQPLQPQTEAQRFLLSSMRTNTLTFATGVAGTGKTWLAAAFAADQLKANNLYKIILTRPAVEAGESHGFLPGTLDEKMLPYLLPVLGVFNERLGKSLTEYMLKTKRIDVVPLAYARGHTYKDCFVLFDEAQNATPVQMKLFLTRIGDNATVVVNGDVSQKDIRGKSGLDDAIERLEDLPGVGIVTFTRADVVRSGFCQAVLERYEM